MQHRGKIARHATKWAFQTGDHMEGALYSQSKNQIRPDCSNDGGCDDDGNNEDMVQNSPVCNWSNGHQFPFVSRAQLSTSHCHLKPEPAGLERSARTVASSPSTVTDSQVSNSRQV